MIAIRKTGKDMDILARQLDFEQATRSQPFPETYLEQSDAFKDTLVSVL